MKKLAFVFGFLALSTPGFAVTPLNSEELQQTVKNGLNWIYNSQEESGHFRYEYAPFWDRYIDDDNIVRQAGALYVVGEIAIRDENKIFNLRGPMEKAVSYFETKSKDGEFNGKNFRCILKTETKCTLGGTSLALIGVLDLVEAYPDSLNKYAGLIEKYKNYILAMQVSGKGFRDSFYFDREQSTKESSFSNGEAFLALVRYYQYVSQTEIKTVIEESFAYFDKIYRGKWDSNFYLWGMAALKDWYALFPEEEYYTFTKDYTDWRIDAQQKARGTSHNKCAYIEGVISAYSVLEKKSSDKEKEKYLEEIDFWLLKSRDLQVKKSDTVKIGFNNGKLRVVKMKSSAKAVGGFLTGYDEPFQRIDFTQHCVSGYLQKLVDIDRKSL